MKNAGPFYWSLLGVRNMINNTIIQIQITLMDKISNLLSPIVLDLSFTIMYVKRTKARTDAIPTSMLDTI